MINIFVHFFLAIPSLSKSNLVKELADLSKLTSIIDLCAPRCSRRIRPIDDNNVTAMTAELSDIENFVEEENEEEDEENNEEDDEDMLQDTVVENLFNKKGALE